MTVSSKPLLAQQLLDSALKFTLRRLSEPRCNPSRDPTNGAATTESNAVRR